MQEGEGVVALGHHSSGWYKGYRLSDPPNKGMYPVNYVGEFLERMEKEEESPSDTEEDQPNGNNQIMEHQQLECKSFFICLVRCSCLLYRR